MRISLRRKNQTCYVDQNNNNRSELSFHANGTDGSPSRPSSARPAVAPTK